MQDEDYRSPTSSAGMQSESVRVVLDGEIVCLDKQGRTQFRDLLFRRGGLRFYASAVLSRRITHISSIATMWSATALRCSSRPAVTIWKESMACDSAKANRTVCR